MSAADCIGFVRAPVTDSRTPLEKRRVSNLNEQSVQTHMTGNEAFQKRGLGEARCTVHRPSVTCANVPRINAVIHIHVYLFIYIYMYIRSEHSILHKTISYHIMRPGASLLILYWISLLPAPLRLPSESGPTAVGPGGGGRGEIHWEGDTHKD